MHIRKEVREQDLLVGNWYAIQVKRSREGFWFMPKINGSAMSYYYFCNARVESSTAGDLSQDNSSFKGSPYYLCGRNETEWCKKVMRDDKWSEPNWREDEELNSLLIF